MASCFWLYSMYRNYQESSTEYQAIAQEAVRVPESSPSTEMKVEEQKVEEISLLTVDFTVLQAMNPDICAWIDFPGMGISYPVVQGSDNTYYLNHSVKKNRIFAGSIFMDVRNHPDFTDDNTILYGHNMKDGSMFGLLSHYKQRGIWEQCPAFYIYTPDHIYRCDIAAFYEVKADVSEYPTIFAQGDEKQFYMENVKKRALYDTGVELSTEDKLVTLSTCTRSSSSRFVIQGCMEEIK